MNRLRTYHPLVFAVLLLVFFALGYVARLRCAAAEAKVRAAEDVHVLLRGPRLAAAGLEGAGAVDFRPLETLYFVLNTLRQQYVEPITDEVEGEMAHDLLRAMLAHLDDPNCRFLDPSERELAESACEGEFQGIGAVLGIKRIKTGQITEEHLIVIAPLASGPAAEAGIQAGDDIVAINGRSVLPFNPFQKANQLAKTEPNAKVWSPALKKKMDLEKKRIENGIPIMEAERKLTEEIGGEVELTIARNGTPREIKIKVKPRKFKVEPATKSVVDGGKIGYVRINCLTSSSGEEVGKAVEQLRSQGVQGLIIDLRNCVGGKLEFALEVAKHFVNGTRIGTLLKSRGRKSEIIVNSVQSDGFGRGPIAVLVNRGTARTAELLAAALKEQCRAKLVGERTYGDLTHATLIEQPDGSAVVFTTGVFLTCSGANYNTKGVPVDIQVAASATRDAQLDEAIKALSASTIGS